MKISNEVKIGLLSIVSIAALILGFNFLKGKNLLDPSTRVYAVFSRVDGISASNPVMINGLQVGNIYKMVERDKNMSGIVVIINLNKDINIPKNSIVTINQSLLSTSTLNIQLGDATTYAVNGDTLLSKDTPGLVDQVQASLHPTLNNVNSTLQSLDSTIKVIGGYFDPATKNNFQAIIANLNTASLSLSKLMDERNGDLAKTMGNLNSFTTTLDKNKGKIENTLDNLEKTTNKFSNLELEKTLTSVQNSMNDLNKLIANANSKNGSLGLLVNDPALYRNLDGTVKSLNILLDDLRVHPKRYVNVSVFGKKDKTTPLMAPLPSDTATKAPQQ